MPATYIHFDEKQKARKEVTGKNWEEIVELGIQKAEEDHKEAQSDT